MLWHATLLNQVAREAAEQAKAAGARIPSWTTAVEEVYETIVYPYLEPLEKAAPEAGDHS
jgi:hypothetical protein